ncbi:MAG: GSU2403 family nucleotidyltransferase fold protein, partial [Burkholderiaceae bacterium]
NGTGYAYWYRVYYPVPGKRAEQFVCKDDDSTTLADARHRVEFAQWMATQVKTLRKLEFQVADKGVASVMVELHNKRVLDAGLTLVGTLAYMCWLNELGVTAVSARTQDIDLAARQHLKLGAPESFLEIVQATQLGFVPVPGMPSSEPSTSVKLQGADGLRVDLLTHGAKLGRSVAVPQLTWHAQTMPFYAYLLEEPQKAAVLAGGHCVPVMLPSAQRFVWHKLYSSAARRSFPEKAEKDLMQAATLAAVLVELQDEDLSDSFGDVPADMKKLVKTRLPALRRALAAHPETREQFVQNLG